MIEIRKMVTSFFMALHLIFIFIITDFPLAIIHLKIYNFKKINYIFSNFTSNK